MNAFRGKAEVRKSSFRTGKNSNFVGCRKKAVVEKKGLKIGKIR